MFPPTGWKRCRRKSRSLWSALNQSANNRNQCDDDGDGDDGDGGGDDFDKSDVNCYLKGALPCEWVNLKVASISFHLVNF